MKKNLLTIYISEINLYKIVGYLFYFIFIFIVFSV